MILTGPEIHRRIDTGDIQMSPFSPTRLNPNSYDLAVGRTIGRYVHETLDAAIDNPLELSEMRDEGELIRPGEIVLGHSAETFGSDELVPIVRAKSSVARLGLFIHATADLIDIGWHGQSTFQFHAVQPLRIYPGMLVAQVTFWVPKGEIVLYHGKYQNTTGPTASRIAAESTTNREALR